MNGEPFNAMDLDDPLARFRKRFKVPDDRVYLDGNSLGALPHGVTERVTRVIEQEWGDELITSWNSNDWIGMPTRVGDRLGRLVGAAPGQVVCTDSISVNLFKLLSAAMMLRPERKRILSQQDNFPTDLYMAEGLATLLGPDRCTIESVPADALRHALDDSVAVLMLTHVNFRDGSLHDMRDITEKAHEHGVLVLWDLAHSAGVIPLELDEWHVDMAVGCGYKFLNGGPGAPAFLYLAKRHQAQAVQPLSGWMGHASPFAFRPGYEPAGDVRRFLAGTPGILGMAALDAALDVFDDVSIEAIRQKSSALTTVFMKTVSKLDLPGIRIITPADPNARGSQVSLAHEHGFEISQALIRSGVIVDFREPDIIRFGFSPLYNRFADAERAAESLRRVVEERQYQDPALSKRPEVT
ncbi:MAG: kynureninase [Lysobacterales bacterium]|jgi:kynureninase